MKNKMPVEIFRSLFRNEEQAEYALEHNVLEIFALRDNDWGAMEVVSIMKLTCEEHEELPKEYEGIWMSDPWYYSPHGATSLERIEWFHRCKPEPVVLTIEIPIYKRVEDVDPFFELADVEKLALGIKLEKPFQIRN
jgi:hypothetical protein